ncbi:unnamed protein product [Allacma fusca]|uniref:PHD-type domain-containing protein n=1 Tax=Allacma fusca TaxID=39272 RepID=A0A8J2JT75_9HEXA|nr:unnamed protein product [Allacma fusca]
MPRSVNSRWSEVTPVLVVDHMVGISIDVFRWLREGVGRDSLWYMLAESLWPRKAGRIQHGREEWRWLKLSFGRNSNGVKDIFCDRVGEWNPGSFIPQRASTPIPETGRYCICNKRWRESDPTMVECANCNNWYHVECIREDVRRVEKKDRFMCPKCANNSHIKFPSLWCSSKSVASCHGVTISTLVGNSAQFIPSTTEDQLQPSDRNQSEDLVHNVSSIGDSYFGVIDSDDDFKSPKKRAHVTTTFPTLKKRKPDAPDLSLDSNLLKTGTTKPISKSLFTHAVDIAIEDHDLAEMLNAKYQDNGDHVVVTTTEGSVSLLEICSSNWSKTSHKGQDSFYSQMSGHHFP